MGMRYYINLLRGKTKALRPAKLTLRNIWAVIQAFFRKKRRGLGGFDLPQHIYEQIIWRRIMVIEKSPECWKSGNCIVCGCEMIGKTIEDRGCSSDTPCYPDMMSKGNWQAYKRINNIRLFE